MGIEEKFGGPLLPLAYEPVKEDDEWSRDFFLENYEKAEELSGLDVETSEGLEKYSAYDPNAFRYTSAQLQEIHKSLSQLSRASLIANSAKNSSNLVELLGEKDAMGLAFGLRSFSSSGNDKDYDAVVDLINDYIEMEQAVKENPSEIAQGILKNVGDENSATYQFFARHVESLIEGSLLAKQASAGEQISSYGANKFINTNIGVARSLQETSDEEKEEQKKIQELERAVDSAEPEEKIEARKKAEKAREEYFEKYKDNVLARQELPNIVANVEKRVYDTLKSEEDSEESD